MRRLLQFKSPKMGSVDSDELLGLGNSGKKPSGDPWTWKVRRYLRPPMRSRILNGLFSLRLSPCLGVGQAVE